MQENIVDLKSIFTTLSGSNVLVLPDAPIFTIVAVSDDYLRVTQRSKEYLIGKGLFEAFPNNPADPNQTSEKTVRASLEFALRYKEPHHLPMQRYDVVMNDGSYVERYWIANSKPVLNDTGDVIYLIHSAEEVTEKIKAEQRQAQLRNIEKAFGLFMHAPMVVGLVIGDNHVLEMANEAAFKLWGKGPEIIGQPILQALPEIEGQGIIELFDQVRTSGQPFFANEVPVSSFINGKEELHYFNLVYQPYYEDDNDRPTGVFTISHDVTEQVMARKQAQQNEVKYCMLFESMEQGYCTLEIIFDENQKCVDYRYLETNPTFEKQSGLTNAIGKTIRELAPSIESKWFDIYGHVALTGRPVRMEEESKALSKWFELYAVRIGNITERKVGVFFTDISARKKADAAIRQSEQRFQSLVRDTMVGIILLSGEEMKVEVVNESYAKLIGRTAADLYDKNLFEVIPEAEAAFRPVIDGVRTTGEPLYLNDTPYFVWVDGERKEGFLNLVYQPYKEADGTISGVMILCHDVTEQVIARMKVEESEVRFRTMAENTPLPIAVADATSNAIYFNKAWTDLTGRPMQDLLQYGWVDLLHPEDQEQFVAIYKDAFAIKGPFRGEFRVLNPHGEYRWLLGHGVARFNSEGEFLGYISACTDITEQKVSQQQLQTALEQVRLSKEAAELGTFDLDLEKGTMHWDDRCRTLFGISHQSPVSYERDFVEGLHPEDRERILKVIDQAFVQSVSNGDYDVEYRTIGAEDGIIRWVRAKGKVYFNRQEKPIRFIGSVLDITNQVMALQKIEKVVEERTQELAQANERLQLYNLELQRSNIHLEEFAHAASHDMKEPIRKVLTFTDRLKKSLGSRMSETESQLFSRMETSTQRMGLLVDDLLEFSHVSERPIQMETVDLNEKLQKVLVDLELQIEEKKAIIQTNGLPVVKGYNRQLQQLLQNLIGNALKYTKKDQQPVITLSLKIVAGKQVADKVLPEQMEQSFYLVEVRDNGIGFEPEYAERIFGMFQRLHGKAEYPGTGVGLSIARKVVENHKGYIWAESQLGEGAAFKLLLPIEGVPVY